jgi:hypothetical protein
MTNGTDQFFDAWKQQVEASVRVMDALVEADAKLRSSQLSAANEAHERTQALEKALADCKNAQELWGAQWNWALATCERSAAYWRNLFEVMQEANAKMARCMQERVQGAAQTRGAGELPATGFPAFDQAYRELLKTSQQFFPALAGRSEPKTKE